MATTPAPDVRATPTRVNYDTPSTTGLSPQQRHGRRPHHSNTSILTRLHVRTGRSRSRSANRGNSSAIISPTSASPTTPADERNARFAHRINSSDSYSSTTSSSSSQQSRGREKRHSGTVMPCGRHANEWLFGDFSIRDTIKNVVRHTSGDHSGEHGHGHHRGGSA